MYLGDLVVLDLYDQDDPPVDIHAECSHGKGLHVANDLLGRLSGHSKHMHFCDMAVVPYYAYCVHGGEAAQRFL